MRKLLLASAAMLGGTMALAGIASAQVQTTYSPVPTIAAPGTAPLGSPSPGTPGLGFGPPSAPSTMTVRIQGRLNVYLGAASSSGQNAHVTPVAAGTTGGTVSTGSPQANTKLAPYGMFEYARLYPSMDAVAANGLKYGAFLEIREDNGIAPGGGANGSTSGAARGRGELYFRRETMYFGADNLGYLRIGATDQPTSLMLTGNFENFNDGGWNGDVEDMFPTGASLTWPFEDVGNLYTTTKVVYLSPQFLKMVDFGVSWSPGTGNVGGNGGPGNCPYGVTYSAGVNGALTSGAALGCDAASASTNASEAGRPTNTVDAVARLRTAVGPLGVAWTIGGFGSGHVTYDGQNYGQPGGPGTQVTKYNGFAVLDSGLQLTYGGFEVGGHLVYGRYNAGWSLQPNGGRNGFAGLIGASYTMGSNVVGFHLFTSESDGSWNQGNAAYHVGTSRTENGLAIGDTFTVAPGAYLMLSYLYGTRHQVGVDLLSGATSSSSGFVSTNNNTRAQGIWVGSMFKW